MIWHSLLGDLEVDVLVGEPEYAMVRVRSVPEGYTRSGFVPRVGDKVYVPLNELEEA